MTIEKQQGGYTGALKIHVLNMVWVNEADGTGIDMTQKAKTVVYAGEKITIVKK